MKLDAYPTTTYDFRYETPPLSGNTINGLGESEPRRASHVFFGDGYARAWGKLDWFFQVMEPTSVHRQIAQMFWQDRRRVGPVARTPTRSPDPSRAAQDIKQVARAAGADLVGICAMSEEFLYDDSDLDFQHAISIGILKMRDQIFARRAKHTAKTPSSQVPPSEPPTSSKT